LQHRAALRRALVAAGQLHPQRQAAVQFGQAFGVQLGAAQIAVQAVAGIVDLGQAGGQHIRNRQEFGLQVFLVLACCGRGSRGW
jgi:hypothetical protein